MEGNIPILIPKLIIVSFLLKLKNIIIRVVIFCLIIACGDFKKRKNDLEISLDQDELDNQEEGLCTGVIISDRFALTAAHCLEEGAKR